MILYSYFRASSAYRVRLGLAMKGITPAETRYINLRESEQLSDAHRATNPQGRVPALVLDDGTILTQSLAILEYLDETHPTPALLPADALGKARVRALAQLIASDIQPMQNIRTTRYLTQQIGASEAQSTAWVKHWITEGLTALEALLHHPATGQFCHSNTPGLADCALVPQIYSAQRFGVDLAPFPLATRIYEACMSLPALAHAHPTAQPDAVA